MTNPTRIKVSLGFTTNMGNFESLRTDIGIEDDAREGETAKQAFERVYGFVSTNLVEKVQEARKDLGG